jgi:protein SCO1
MELHAGAMRRNTRTGGVLGKSWRSIDLGGAVRYIRPMAARRSRHVSDAMIVPRSRAGITPVGAMALSIFFGLMATLAVGWGMKQRLEASASFFGTAYPDPESAPAFELVNHEGEPESLEAHRGNVVLLFFGFTHCPDVCPLTLARLANLRERMGRRGEQVNILLITVDPERDTPAVLADYVARFGPAVTGLTGDPDRLERIRKVYGVFAAPHAGHDGHTMLAHTDAVFGIDPVGRLRVLIRPDAPDEEIVADVRRLLRSSNR